jgi:hypothetical protein
MRRTAAGGKVLVLHRDKGLPWYLWLVRASTDFQVGGSGMRPCVRRDASGFSSTLLHQTILNLL